MLQHAKRATTVSEALSLLSLSDQNVHDERPVPAKQGVARDLFPSTHSGKITVSEWIEKTLHCDSGVIAALPGTEMRKAATVALDQRAACGHARVWEVNLCCAASAFHPAKNTNPQFNRTIMRAVTLQSGVMEFFPEGDVFGFDAKDTDAYIDAGLTVEIRKHPYASKHELLTAKTTERQMSACCTELALLFSASERGIAPAVLACFFSDGTKSDTRGWTLGPKSAVDADMITPRDFTQIPRLVTVSQLSTFTLKDLMWAIRSAPVQSRRDHLIDVLRDVCPPTFQKIKEMCTVHKGYGIVKLNMTPDTIVFCPELIEGSEGEWTLSGYGYMPVSDAFVDGMPKLVDFNSILTSRVQESSYSEEGSFALECMLLVAFSRALHGPVISDVLWKYLLAPGDPASFVAAMRSIESKHTNLSSFLSCIAANPDMREEHDTAKAISGVVSDIDRIARSKVITADGELNNDECAYFSRLVCLVAETTDADTRIFKRLTTNELIEEEVEREHRVAMEEIKMRRLERLRSLSRLSKRGE